MSYRPRPATPHRTAAHARAAPRQGPRGAGLGFGARGVQLPSPEELLQVATAPHAIIGAVIALEPFLHSGNVLVPPRISCERRHSRGWR